MHFVYQIGWIQTWKIHLDHQSNFYIDTLYV